MQKFSKGLSRVIVAIPISAALMLAASYIFLLLPQDPVKDKAVILMFFIILFMAAAELVLSLVYVGIIIFLRTKKLTDNLVSSIGKVLLCDILMVVASVLSFFLALGAAHF